MSVVTLPTKSLTCSRCSRVTRDPEGEMWRFDSPPLVVQGVALGVCRFCLTGQEPPKEGERRCDGTCEGGYRPEHGTYFEARWGTYFRPRETWACWDEACCWQWAEEQDDECDCCGSDLDVRVVKYVDGKQTV